ncbi:hypothetical protein [Amycolatopsis samaneae]|uniref:Uncharacterized protein n=1 Tax=Amycolatopsis samaneae TaxID=664691 RepID=A0ABW5GE93_9PSEU
MNTTISSHPASRGNEWTRRHGNEWTRFHGNEWGPGNEWNRHGNEWGR